VFGSSYEPSRAQLRQCLVGSMSSALPYKNKMPFGPYKVFRKAIGSLRRRLELRRGRRRREPARGAASASERSRQRQREEPPRAPTPGRRAPMLRRSRWPASSARRDAVVRMWNAGRPLRRRCTADSSAAASAARTTVGGGGRRPVRSETTVDSGSVAVEDCEDGLGREEREEKKRNERKGRDRAGVWGWGGHGFAGRTRPGWRFRSRWALPKSLDRANKQTNIG
jgi:hypothetical protein